MTTNIVNIDFLAIIKFLNYAGMRIKNNSLIDNNTLKVCLFKNDLGGNWNITLMILKHVARFGRMECEEFIDFDFTRSDSYYELEFINKNNNKEFSDIIYEFLFKSSLEIMKELKTENSIVNNHHSYSKPSTKNKGSNIQDSIIWLEYNNKILTICTKDQSMRICKCNTGSLNDNLLKFLIANPNKTWKRVELNERSILKTNTAQSKTRNTDKSFYTFLCDVKIRGKNSFSKIGDLFFNKDMSENSIHLKNPIWSESDFEEIDLRMIYEDESIQSYFSKNSDKILKENS